MQMGLHKRQALNKNSHNIEAVKVDDYDIGLYNPQFRGNEFEVPETRRRAFHEVVSTIDNAGITAVVGLRRVGKTVLLKQILNSLMREDREFFYFSFDEDRYANLDGLESVIRTSLNFLDSPIVALDEVSRIKGWAGTIKKYHDTKGVRFLLSGSASLEITKGKESLAGRLFDFYLPPLQYMEFISFQKGKDPLKGLKMDLNKPEKTFIEWNDSGHLKDFLSRGSFPELINVKEDVFIKKYILSSTVEKIIFEDLPKTFGITDQDALYRLWELVSSKPSMLFVPSNLEHTVGLTRDTISKYLFYLERAYLVRSVWKKASVSSKLRKGRKVYPPAPCIAYQMGKDETSMGAVAETAVLDKLQNGLSMEVFFYRGSRRSEVDFIADGIPIEVKFQSSIGPGDSHNLIRYMNAKSIEKGIMITKKDTGVLDRNGVRVIMIPLELFLQIESLQTE